MTRIVVVAVAIALFYAGRRAHPARRAAVTDELAGERAGLADAPTSSAARRAAMQTLLARLAHAPRQPPQQMPPHARVERSVAEPPEVTTKRRQRATAEIDERAPGLPAAKRAVLLEEADRLAWDKRQLRAAFLAGTLSEADYVAALKDDIRAALADFAETLSEDEYVALFNRRPGSDPFTMESLVGRPAEPR